MNIYCRELRANFKSFLLWCIGIIAIVGGGMGKYAGFSSSTQSVTAIMDKMPKSLLAIFGMNGLDMSTASGFYAVVFFYVLIVSTIYSIMLGANIIAKEERDKTSEFLFTKPVSRNRVVSSKLIAALTYTILYNLVNISISMTVVGKVAPNESGLTRDILILGAGMFFAQLIFLFIGTGTAAVIKKPGASSGIATGILLAAYFLSMVIDLTEDLDFLKYLTPFKYFEAKNLINGGSPELIFIVISVLLIAFFLSATYIFFPKRDLYI